MKRIILSFTLLLACASAWADHWTAPSAYDYDSESPVYVTLTINGGVATNDTIVELAAFIGDECRAIAKQTADNGKYLLRVRGTNTDNGKTIVYKAYHKGLEYGLQPETPTVFNDEMTNSNVNLTLSAITGITTANPLCVTANLPCEETLVYTYLYHNAKGKNITPSSRCTVLSPLTFSWTPTNSDYFTINKDKLNITGECAEVPLQCTVKGPKYGTKQFTKTCSTELTASYPVSFNFPASLELNRFQTTTINLPNLIGSIFDPSLVEFQFPTICGVPMAYVSYERTNNKWNFKIYGNITGQATYKVLYDGVPFKSTDNSETATVTVTASQDIPSGWSWLSLFATDDVTDNFNLMKSESEYNNWAKSYINEVRSQFYLLYNDPLFGLFGDIKNLNVADGMYKVKVNADTKITLGHKTTNGFTVTKDIHKGYNWFNNPYQLDLTLSQLSSALNISPRNGDKIIGKTSFAEYNGTKWQSSSSFVLEAGQGYMYYSTNPNVVTMSFNSDITYTCNSFVNSLVNIPFSFGTRRRIAEVKEQSHWTYDDSRFADNMAVVALLEGISNPSDYSIGAFVGDECRGEGEASESGNMFINVAGKSGEVVTFKLYNKQTEEVVELNESLQYTKIIGSISEPVTLTSDALTTGISFADTSNADITEIHDIAGRKLKAMSRGTYLVTYNNNGTVITKKVVQK